jgi:hypothetical protein
MQKVRILLILLGLCWFSGQTTALFAQAYDDEEEDPGSDDAETDYWDGYISDLYSFGDQTFTITLGFVFPTVFLNNGTKIDHHFTPPVGGAGSLAYNFFFGAHYYLGAEIGMKFFYTLGNGVIFFIPFGIRTGWQFVLGRFEFPIYFVVGVAPQRYLNSSMAGLFVKGGASAFFRFNSDWSFGLNTDWNWYPQWPKEDGKRVPSKDVDGNILGITLSARYHF